MITQDVDPQCRSVIDASDPDEVIVCVRSTNALRSRAIAFRDLDKFLEAVAGPAFAEGFKRDRAELRNTETGEPMIFEPLPHGRRWVFTLEANKPVRIEHRMTSHHQWSRA